MFKCLQATNGDDILIMTVFQGHCDSIMKEPQISFHRPSAVLFYLTKNNAGICQVKIPG